MSIDTPLTDAELDRLDNFLVSDDAPENTMDTSMLDGYLAAVASGPNLVMPDQMLRWVWDNETDMPETTECVNLILRHYKATNDALNDGVYTAQFTDPRAWCRGYLVGFSVDMTPWERLLSTQPDLLKMILGVAEGKPLNDVGTSLADTVRRIHTFWVEQRHRGLQSGNILGLFTADSMPNRVTTSPHRQH